MLLHFLWAKYHHTITITVRFSEVFISLSSNWQQYRKTLSVINPLLSLNQNLRTLSNYCQKNWLSQLLWAWHSTAIKKFQMASDSIIPIPIHFKIRKFFALIWCVRSTRALTMVGLMVHNETLVFLVWIDLSEKRRIGSNIFWPEQQLPHKMDILCHLLHIAAIFTRPSLRMKIPDIWLFDRFSQKHLENLMGHNQRMGSSIKFSPPQSPVQ